MEAIKTDIEGVLLIRPRVFEDARGYFMETFNAANAFRRFVQDNESSSVRAVMRGLHFQRPPHDQAKLVRVTQGAVLDIAVDLRSSSPTYGRYVAAELSAENRLQMFIPEGFAHGFAVLSPVAVFEYKCSKFFEPSAAVTLDLFDPDLNLPWPFAESEALLSEKDRKGLKFSSFVSPF